MQHEVALFIPALLHRAREPFRVVRRSQKLKAKQSKAKQERRGRQAEAWNDRSIDRWHALDTIYNKGTNERERKRGGGGDVTSRDEEKKKESILRGRWVEP